MAQARHAVFRVVDCHAEIIVCQCRQPHGITREGQYRVNDGFNHCPVARNQLTGDIHLTSRQLFKRVKRHQIRATPGGNQPQIVTLQANGGVQRGKRSACVAGNPCSISRFSSAIIPPFSSSMSGGTSSVQTVICDEVGQRFQGADNIGQQIRMRTADLQRQPGAQFFQRIVCGG
jgi:hypothetical protein